VTLVRDENYPDGKVGPDGYIYKNVPDQAVLVEQFLAGETNFIDTPPQARRADVEKNTAVVPYKYPGNQWDYITLNLADPTNPQSAVDDKGVPTGADQGHHPLFGDVRVRRALQLGTNVPQMVKTAVFGYGTQMASGIIPSSWAFDKDLKPIGYDPAAAGKMLDEAGFPKGADGIRVAKGAKYAPDGTPFKFTLFTNDGNSRRTAAGTIFQDNMKDLGIVVDFQPIEFNTELDKLNQQTYDAILIGWRNSFPDDPDLTQIFGTTGDVVGSGSNSGSYSNPALDKNQKEALAVPGCDPAKRAELYKVAQKMLQDDQPYIFLYVLDGMYAARKNVVGFDPRPSNPFWNVDKWTIGPPVATK
jgi:peptide/nickel transport system substrate-binding protein